MALDYCRAGFGVNFWYWQTNNAGKDLGAALHDFKKSLNGEDKNKSEEKTNPKQEQQKD